MSLVVELLIRVVQTVFKDAAVFDDHLFGDVIVLVADAKYAREAEFTRQRQSLRQHGRGIAPPSQEGRTA